MACGWRFLRLQSNGQHLATALNGHRDRVASVDSAEQFGETLLVAHPLPVEQQDQIVGLQSSFRGRTVDDDFVEGIERESALKGYLDKFFMGRTFSYLRSNDLVYGPAIKSYMLGEAPPAFDLLYWNGDGTNLPGPMVTEYLRKLQSKNTCCFRQLFPKRHSSLKEHKGSKIFFNALMNQLAHREHYPN